MKILIISDQVGRTAPGIVFERLILGLLNTNKIDLCVSGYEPSLDLSRVGKIIKFKKIAAFPRLSKFLFTHLGVSIFDSYNASHAIGLLSKSEIVEYDFIFCFLSYNHYTALVAGIYFKKKFHKKIVVYSVDAIPAPIGWLKNDKFYSALKRFVKKHFSEIDVFYSSNQKMLEYQLGFFKSHKLLFSGVLLSPSIGGLINYPVPNDGIERFVYSGGIYGLRTSKFLLEAFKMLIDIYPKSKLIFVGTKFEMDSLTIITNQFSDNVEIYPFTSDLSSFYKDATALIDIDAAVDNDVFLSSKVVNYLMINRIIISETGKNSPSRIMFSGVNSIIQCDHDAFELFQAMIKSIQFKSNMDFEDRAAILDCFSLKNVISKLSSELNSVFHNLGSQ